MEGLTVGQIVTSRKGRDVCRVYVAIGFDGEWVLVADGVKRTLSQPKRKNLRHLQPVNQSLTPGQMQTDLTVKAALKAYQQARDAQQQGG